MYKDSRISFVFVLCILGIALIFFLCLHPTSGMIYSSDNMIVALSVLVTVLIGWNIYSALGMKDDIEKYKNQIDNNIKQLENSIHENKKESRNAINELKGKRGILNVSHSEIKLSKDGGKAYFTIDSNTKWNIYVNQNSERPTIKNLNVYPLNGEGDATITIEYDAVNTQHYDELITLVVKFKSFDTSQSSVVSLRRKNLPQ
jgi:hypothetical protein